MDIYVISIIYDLSGRSGAIGYYSTKELAQLKLATIKNEKEIELLYNVSGARSKDVRDLLLSTRIECTGDSVSIFRENKFFMRYVLTKETVLDSI